MVCRLLGVNLDFTWQKNLLLYKNSAKLSYLRLDILKNEVRYCKQHSFFLAQSHFGCDGQLHQSVTLSSLKVTRAAGHAVITLNKTCICYQ
jgi:hypothetical protein